MLSMQAGRLAVPLKLFSGGISPGLLAIHRIAVMQPDEIKVRALL